jgi:hypothetical protein
LSLLVLDKQVNGFKGACGRDLRLELLVAVLVVIHVKGLGEYRGYILKEVLGRIVNVLLRGVNKVPYIY